MKKIKLFAIAVAALLCGNAMAETVVVTSATASYLPTPEEGTVTAKAANKNTADGYKLSNSGDWVQWVLTESTISEASFSGWINSDNTTYTFGVQFTTDNGATWGDNITIYSDGTKAESIYAIEKSDIPEGANGMRVSRTSGTSTYLCSITLVYGGNIAYPFVKSFTVAGVEAVVDTAAKTIVAELPYGTDRTAAIENAEVVMGGTAKTYSIAGDVLTAIDSADVAKNIDYDLTGIVVSENPSTDATLSMITVDGKDLVGFDPAVLSYSMIATEIPTVDAVVNDPNAEYYVNPALDFPDMTEIFVTAQDGVTKLTYSINFTSAEKICGQLVKAVPTGKTTATVIGALPATAAVKLSGTAEYEGLTGYKLNTTGAYFGITLTQGAFKAGDVFNFFATACDEGKYAELFTDEGTTSIYVAPEATVLGLNSIVLPAEAEGATSLYLYRTAGNAYNATVAYIEVVRDCEPKLVAFSMAGVDAVIDQELKTVTAVLPFGTVLTDNDWNNAYTLNGAATDAEYDAGHTTLTVNGEDAAIAYTLNITISQTPSSNANLSEITVNGNAIADFRADSLTYAYELPNGTVDMPVIAAVAEDITAQVVVDEITALDQLVKIVVTAQDASTQTYTVQLSVASAPKYLYEAVFSNGAKGAIDNDAAAIVVPYLDGTTYPTLVSDSVSAGASAAMSGEDKLIVTGSDMSTKEFSITFQALSAPSFVADTITFDGSESYIYAAYGWDAEKGVKFSKAVNEETNMRITTGKTRVYMALPACYKVTLISGSGQKRAINVSLNGGAPAAMTTAATGAGMDVLLSTTEVNFVAIESAQTGGDGGFVKMVMTLDVPSGNEPIQGNVQENKFIYNGQFYMLNNGVLFNALGQEVAK